jgi:ATP-binding cassette subfamily B (MDR/TAP) protein 1
MRAPSSSLLTTQVSFAYPSRPEQLALDSASFFFPAGETTFVIGKSGSGKSTLGNLLMRFYAPRSGDLLIDGNSITALDLSWLRNNVTLVQQQSVLFNETIFKNIAFGRRDHNRVRKEEVKRSIETAYLQNTIMELPLGLDTVVGTGGSAMSGGQRQRVAIARARLRDTPILILDEATSALDYISRTSVMAAIREWRRGKTTIVVTHDMSQIQENEYAYVLDNGVLVQEGFRQALEKAENGPFEKTPSGMNNFPATQHEAHVRPSSGPDDGTSLAWMDPMDINIQPRPNFIPSVFAPSPKDLRFRRASQGLLSPLSPVAFPSHRMSTPPSAFARSRSNGLPAMDILDCLPPEQLGHSEDAGRQLRHSSYSTDHSKNLDSASRQGRRHDLGKSMTALKHRNFMRPRRRKLTKAEKARRIAPARKILMTVWPTLHWRMRITLISGFVFAAIHAGGTPAFSWVFSKLLATFFLTSNRSQMALKWSLSVLGVAIVDSIASYSMHYLLESCGQAWIDSLRVQALRRILDQPRAWFDRDKNNLTKLTECLDRNAEEMRNLIGRFAGFGFVAVTMMLVAIVWSLILCWNLTLVGLASGPVLYVVTRSFEGVSGKWERKSNDASEHASVIFTETFANIRVVRALTLEAYFHKKHAKATSMAMKVGFKRSAYSGFFFGLSDSGIIFVTGRRFKSVKIEPCAHIFIALIFYYGAVLVSSGRYTVQDILTVFTMLLFSIASANAIIAFSRLYSGPRLFVKLTNCLVPQMNSSRDTATRLLRLSNLPYKASHEHSGHIRLSKPGPITFESLSFVYPSRPDAPVLSNFNLNLDSTTSTALVGASGSGKSTITSLLLGLYPPTSGQITFSSFSISDLHLPTLRNLISVVPQSPALFPTTIARNITYGLPETSRLASMSSVYAASAAAGIHSFISSLPQGYQTLIGKGGTDLSGGQAQRIVIARAIVRKPQLLILDEATSGLDGQSAKVVRDLVGRLEREGIGVVIVAHDREMMKGCRDVVVLGEGGRVMERGSFDKLLSRRNGELRRLVGGK